MTYTILNMADSIEDPTDKWPQSEPDARDFGDILAGSLNLTGVVSGCAVTAQGTPDMTVAVASGVAIVGGTSATVAAGNVTIGAAGAQPRFDLVCVSSAGVKSAVAGTGATNPVFPDPAGKAVLAAIYIPGSDTDIDSNQIVDKRVIIKPWTQLSGDTMTGSLTIQTAVASAQMLLTGDTQNAQYRVSAYGDTSATAPLPSLLSRRFRGTVAAPLRTKAADLMGRFGATGGHAADDVSAATQLTAASVYLDFRALEAFTSTARGTEIRFVITPIGSTTANESMRLLNFTGQTYGCLIMDDVNGYAADKRARFVVHRAVTNLTSDQYAAYFRVLRYGGGALSDGSTGFFSQAADHASAAQVTITGAANNGSGLIRITCASHPFQTGDRVGIGNVGGVTNANAAWTVTRISATQFDLQSSTFAGVYTSGGSATTAGCLSGAVFSVAPSVTRVLSSATGTATDGDDVIAVAGFNSGTAKGMECFYIGRNASGFPSTSEWIAGFAIAGNVDIGFRHASGSTIATAGLAFEGTITTGDAIVLGAGHNIKLATSTGTKIGTGTTQLLAFHNSTPVAQQTVTGSRASGAALADLLTKLAAKGLIVDGSSA